MKKIIATITIGVAGFAGFWLVSTSRAATEQAEYVVVRTDGAFAVRDYPELKVASVPLKGDGMNDGFGHLFRYITGGNEGGEKISMTAPVLIDRTPGRETMSFVMPKAAAEKTLPIPRGETVKLGKVRAARFAVYRFSGGRSGKNEIAALKKLNAWMTAEKLTGRGEPVFGYFDPPWTPAFMRRNEVMLRVK